MFTLTKFATHVHTYPFKSAPERNAESFDVEQFGRILVLDGKGIQSGLQAMQQACT